jgi:dihydropteroate synthase
MSQLFHCGRYILDVTRPLIMGIVNLTDDSFSGDAMGSNSRVAVAHGLKLLEEGAHILDLGAESSRPGANSVSVQQELDRLLPVIDGLRDCGVPLSIDTAKPDVMRAALAAGADMINDIYALQAPGAIAAVAASRAAVCMMHMQGDPGSMQINPHYDDVVADVAGFLGERVAAAEAAGIDLSRICVDPGFGFGKALAHNLELLRHLDEMLVPGLPLLVGMSRKSMLGLITRQSVGDRMVASIAAHLIAVQRGARILRVHDVAATRDALAVLAAVENY